MDNLTVKEATRIIIDQESAVSMMGFVSIGLFEFLSDFRISMVIQTLTALLCLALCWKAIRAEEKKGFSMAIFALYVIVLHKDVFIIGMGIYVLKLLGKREYLKESGDSSIIGYPSLYMMFSPLSIAGDIGCGSIIGILTRLENRRPIIDVSNNRKGVVIAIMVVFFLELTFFTVITNLGFEICTLEMIAVEILAIYFAVIAFYILPILISILV